MIKIGNKPIDTLYVGSKLVQQMYLGNRKIYPEEGVIPKQIKDAMVLWYDLKRQGATNESMSANPTLVDLSGNGHDATCYNFAWSGMSGIGGYPVSDFTFNGVIPTNGGWKPICSVRDYIKQPFKVLINCKGHEGEHVEIISAYRDNDTGDIISRIINNDVIIGQVCTVPVLEVNDYEESIYFNMNYYSGEEVSIQAISEYSNALVSDGVDDYCMVENVPILTDYTVIAKRKFLNSINLDYGVFSKRSINETGAFVVEKDSSRAYSFGYLNVYISPSNNDIIYQTKNEYCGIKLLDGGKDDTDFLLLSAGYKNANNDIVEICSTAIYSFILFNRTLSAEEINWVEANLIGK